MRRGALFCDVLLFLVCGTAFATGHPGLDKMLRERSPTCPRPLPDRSIPSHQAYRYPPLRLSAPSLLDSVVRDDFVCNDDDYGGARQDGPSIASDRSGRFVVVWYEFRDGDADVWFQRFDSAGNPLGQNERLNTDATMGWQGDPAVAMSPDGRYLSSWEDRRDIGNSDLFCQRFDASGQRLGDNFRVSDSGVPGDQSFSGAAMGPDGTALIAWDDRRFGITGDIFAQFLAPDGTPRDTNFRVNDDPIGRANQYEPSVSCDDSGRFVVAWMDGRGLNAYDWNIFCQRFDRLGNRLGSNIQVTTNDSIQWAPAVACTPDGGFAVCWEDRRTGQWDAYVQFYNSLGQPLGGNVKVNDDVGPADQSAVSVGANRLGEYLVTWADRRNGNSDVYAQRYSGSGTALGSNFLVNDDATSTDQGAPTVAACPDGGYWVVWVDRRNGNNDLYCRRFGRDGTPQTASFRVNDDTASSHQRVSSIGMDAIGNTVVAWEDERSGECDIYRSVFDASGQTVGPNVKLNDDGISGASQYYAAVAAGKGRFIATWTDNRDGEFSIYGRFLDAVGMPVGPNFLVNSDTSGAFQWYSYCAMDTSNRAAVVWMDGREDAYRVFCRRYRPDGQPEGPEFVLSDGGGNQYYASVAMSRNGWLVAAWMDYRQGDGDIYCQLFRPDGSRVGPNIMVSIDTGNVYQGYPACAVSDNGQFVVAWEDTRNDIYDVYMQWFDSTGARLGGNERVNDNTTETDCYSPTCAFDDSGRLALAFNDERDSPGTPQIYCQRFRADRTRVSGNRRVNQPGLFPNNHHWTVGQSVAARQVLAFAWTDNRRHQGWDIFAKLTDWELVGIANPVASAKPEAWVRPTVSAGRFLVDIGSVGPALVHVLDRAGRKVLAAEVAGGRQVLDLGSLGRGVYLCRIESNGQQLTRKLVVR